jgi:hypothetical protein
MYVIDKHGSSEIMDGPCFDLNDLSIYGRSTCLSPELLVINLGVDDTGVAKIVGQGNP